MTWLKNNWKKLLLGLALVLTAAAIVIFWPVRKDLSSLAARAEKYNAHILRDTYGVPHVFGRTDADAAYALAYAHAEDDFLTIQQIMLAARGQLGLAYGLDGAPNDYMVHLLKIWPNIEAKYTTDLSPEVRAISEAYADGLNVYAALHPDEVLVPELFPLTGKDTVAASVHKSPLFFGFERTLAQLFSDEPELKPTPTAVPYNSNAFAIGPSRTSDGQTFLDVNSHQPWTGPVAWYEAHIHSEEGWDAAGALFPATPLIIHGHNRNLGWAFTVNEPDLVDVYRLEINPANRNQYRFDGQWRDLEVTQATLHVKLIGNLVIPVQREVLWSVYGPAIRNGEAVYAVRYAGMGTIGIWEQLYRMNKAANFTEWQNAMRLGQLPMFNTVYADREGNIYYLYNGLLPVRAEGYDWDAYLPGNTSATLWTEYWDFDSLPQVFNPPAGFVQNANATPFQATLGPGNPDPAAYPAYLRIDPNQSNRSLRLLELLGADESITPEEFVVYKFDMCYSTQSDVARFQQILAGAQMPPLAELTRAQEIVRNWNLCTDPENTGAALMVYTLAYLKQNYPDSLDVSEMAGTDNVSEAMLVQSFTLAVQTLNTHFGRVDVRWSDANRLVRGNVNLGLGGGPDILHAVYGDINPDTGRRIGSSGDSYVMLVTWDKNGNVSAQSIHQFGSATLDASSPHYADQSPLFVARQLKPAWFNEADIRANLKSEYVPGQENR